MAATKISCNLSEDEFRKLQALLGRSRMARLLGVTIARIQQFKRKYKMTDPANFKGKFKPAFNVPKEQLAEMYIGEKMSVHEIAKSLGWSDWTIIKALRKEGLYKGRGGHLKEDIPVPVEVVEAPVVEMVEKPPEPEKPVEAPSEPMPEIPDEEYDVPVDEPVKETVVLEAPKPPETPNPSDDKKWRAKVKALKKETEEFEKANPPSQEKPESGAVLGNTPSSTQAVSMELSGPETKGAKPSDDKCPTCGGTGKSYSHSHELDCPTCKGTGNKPKESDTDKAVKESIERIKNLQKTVEDNKKKIKDIKNLRKKKDGVKVEETTSNSRSEGDKDGLKSDTGEPQPK